MGWQAKASLRFELLRNAICWCLQPDLRCVEELLNRGLEGDQKEAWCLQPDHGSIPKGSQFLGDAKLNLHGATKAACPGAPIWPRRKSNLMTWWCWMYLHRIRRMSEHPKDVSDSTTTLSSSPTADKVSDSIDRGVNIQGYQHCTQTQLKKGWWFGLVVWYFWKSLFSRIKNWISWKFYLFLSRGANDLKYAWFKSTYCLKTWLQGQLKISRSQFDCIYISFSQRFRVIFM